MQAPIGSERQKRNADTAFHACADMESTKMVDDDIPQPMLSEMNEAVNQPSYIPSSPLNSLVFYKHNRLSIWKLLLIQVILDELRTEKD